MSLRNEIVFVASLIAVLSLTWLPRLRGPIDLRWDAAVYYSLGTALNEGEGYRFLSEPGEVKATNYPPLLPAVIALHQRLLGTTDPIVVGHILRISFLLLWVAYLGVAYALLRRYLSPPLAAVGTSLCGLHIRAVWLSDRAYADLPFAVCALLFLITAAQPPRTTARAAMSWIFATLAFLARTTGVALYAGWVAEALLRRQYRSALARTAVALIPIFAWQGYIAHVESEPSYRHPSYPYARADYVFYNVSYTRNNMLRDPTAPERGRATTGGLVRRVLANTTVAPLYIGGAVGASEKDLDLVMETRIKRSSVGRFVPWRAVPLALLALGCIVILGLVVLFARGESLLAMVAGAYVAQLTLLNTTWHWPRYFVGIAPLLILGFVVGLLTLAKWVSASSRVRIGAAPLAGTVMSFVLVMQIGMLGWYFADQSREIVHEDWNGRRVAYRLFAYDRPFEALDSALDWLQQHASAGEIAVSSMAPWTHLRTGVVAVMPPLDRHTENAQALLDAVPARYVIVDTCGFSFTHEYTLPVVRQEPERWRLVYTTTDGAAQVFARRVDSESQVAATRP